MGNPRNALVIYGLGGVGVFLASVYSDLLSGRTCLITWGTDGSHECDLECPCAKLVFMPDLAPSNDAIQSFYNQGGPGE